jgi:hypothetical protein
MGDWTIGCRVITKDRKDRKEKIADHKQKIAMIADYIMIDWSFLTLYELPDGQLDDWLKNNCMIAWWQSCDRRE